LPARSSAPEETVSGRALGKFCSLAGAYCHAEAADDAGATPTGVGNAFIVTIHLNARHSVQLLEL